MADPWAVTATAKADDDPWGVVRVDVPAGSAVLSPGKRTLGERFTDNVEEGRRSSLSGAGADALAASLPGPTGDFYRWQNQDEADAYRLRSEADPWYRAPGNLFDKAGAGLATLGGLVAGGLPSPESLIGPGKTALARIGFNASINAAVDPVVQGLQNVAGSRQGYDPLQTVAAAGTGALIQGGFEVAGPAARAVGGALTNAAKAAGRVIEGGLERLDGQSHVPTRGEDAWTVAGVEPASPAAPPAGGWDVTNVARTAPPKPAPSGPIADMVRAEASRQGVDPATALRIAEIESPGLNPSLKNPKSSAAGLYQFTDGTWAAMGGGDKMDPALNASRGVELIRQNTDALTKKLGRPPEPWEIYLAHQQGAGGAGALLNGGETRAIDALKAAGVSDKRARESVLNNGGTEDMTAAQFADLWKRKYGPQAASEAAATMPRVAEPEAPDMAPRPPRVELEEVAFGRPDPEPRPADMQFGGGRLDSEGSAVRGWDVTGVSRSDAPTAAEFAPNAFRDPALRGALIRRASATADNGVAPNRPILSREPLAMAPRPPGRLYSAAATPPGFNAARAAPTQLPPRTKFPEGMAMMATPFDRGLPRLSSPATPSLASLSARGRRAAIDLSAYGGAMHASRGAGNVTGARPSLARSVEEGSPEYAGQSVSQLAERLRQTLGITQRQRRLTMKRAVGEFDPRSGVIRTKAARHAIDHLAHEAGHKLQHMRTPALARAIEQHGPEIDRLAYEGANPAHTREEGFSEFFRAYLLNPAEAQLRAPNFYRAFEEALGADRPDVAADLGAIQKAYRDLLEGSALHVASASVAYTGKPGVVGAARKALTEDGVFPTILAGLDEVYRGVFDRNHPFNVWLRRAQQLATDNRGRRFDMEMANNPYVLARQAEHAFAMAQSDLQFGVTPYHGVDPEGPAINDVYKTAFGARQPTPEEDAQFAAYLIARRMRHEWGRFYRGELEREPDKIEHDQAFHERVVADAERLHPEWKAAAEQATEFARNLWSFWRDAGMISEATHRAGVEKHPDYVPVMRDMSDQAAPGGRGRASGAGQYAGGAKVFEGSQRDIIHPLVSLTRQAFEMRAAVARNEVVRAMHSATKKAGDNSGALLEELPRHEVEAIQVDAMEALRAAAKAFGLDERDQSSFSVFQNAELEGLVKATLFQRSEFAPRRGESVVFKWENGEKIPLLLPDGKLGRDLFTAISGMTKDTRAVWEEVAAGAAQALRLGVTGLPEFAVKTTIRDQMAAAILTDVGYVPFKDLAGGFGHAAGHSQTYKQYSAAGGLKGGVNVAALRRPFPKNDVQAKAQMKALQPRVVPVQAWRNVLHLVDFGDTATRLGVFHKALRKAKARGLSDYQAVIEARHVSADFFDPTRHGAWPGIVQAARTIPFMNSGLQGPDVMFRTLRHAFAKPQTMADKRQFAKAWRSAALLAATTVLGATVVSAWHDDPDFQNINDQTRGTHWPVWKRANGEWIFYPKSFELGMPSNLTERVLNWMLEGDPKTLERIRKDVFNTMVPAHEATALSVPFQIAANRDRNGKPIVPEHLRGTVDPDQQVSAWTSDTAKALAGGVVSPAVVEYLITGFLGTAGRDALRLSDAAIHRMQGQPGMSDRAPDSYLTRGYVRRTARGSDAEQSFWKLAGKTGEWERAANTVDLLIRDGKVQQAKDYIGDLDPEKRAYVVARSLLGGEAAKVEPMSRARNAVGVLSAMRRENRQGVLTGANGQVIDLTPAQRRAVDDALDDLALAEVHNAQVRSGVRGWANRPLLDRSTPADFLDGVDPAVTRAVEARFATEGVYPAAASARAWEKISQIPASMSPQLQDVLITRKRTASKEGKFRTVRQVAAERATAERQAARRSLWPN